MFSLIKKEQLVLILLIQEIKLISINKTVSTS